ncbi:hypothetical protein [Phycobacter sp. K97]|uniref:hypothetical protein n=1 Tax=Phycobacter sedimenti TaxID=3133977 RepID=UPI00311D38DF
MEEISQQLLYQRLRNRVIELFEIHSSIEDIASMGAFETINMVDDWLPLDFEKAPKVFSEAEKEAIAEFIQLAEVAADATEEDTWDIEWFRASREWVRLSQFAKYVLDIFSERGRFSEESEEIFAM